jgi:uncharacterized protein involved in oxidation of intracellular sulfur
VHNNFWVAHGGVLRREEEKKAGLAESGTPNNPRQRKQVRGTLIKEEIFLGTLITRRKNMKILFIISSDDAETIYNAMRLANVADKKGDEVSVFMLGKGVLYEKSGNDQFNVIEQVNQFEGDFYV